MKRILTDPADAHPFDSPLYPETRSSSQAFGVR